MNPVWDVIARFFDGVEALIGHDMTVFLCGALSVVFLWGGIKAQISTDRILREMRERK